MDLRGKCVDMEKELSRQRIKILQECKEDLAKKINPLLSDEIAGLYQSLAKKIDETIDAEAKNQIADLSTQEVVDELAKREAVEKITASPYELKEIEVTGPAVILIIYD